jgi:DNA-binding transcriptional MerR regulator
MSKKEYKAAVKQAEHDLNAILNDETDWTLEEQLDRINELKKIDFSKKNPEIVEMIERAEQKVTNAIAERDRIAEQKRLEEEQRLRELEEQNKPKTALTDYFTMIANAKDVTTANNFIKEALKMFESPDAVVLIRLNNYGDYDRPTTAVNYLNYLKDQKKVNVAVDNVKYNEEHKITELELIKK